MSIISIAAAGVGAALMAVQLKGMKGEYGLYLAAAAGFFIFFYAIAKLETILEAVKQIQGYIRINQVYLGTLMKMVGITYVAEFASGICKDAGFSALGTQIEVFGKLSILAVSTPILLALMETLGAFLQ